MHHSELIPPKQNSVVYLKNIQTIMLETECKQEVMGDLS